jgi:hypothetical protein
MLHRRKCALRGSSAVIAACALTATGLVATGTSASAAPGCRAVRPQSEFYEAGRVASELLTVPVSARCTTISVRNIQDPQNPDDHCATFLVGFFPPEAESEYTEPVHACSAGPRGPEVVLATGVPDGTTYRVLYQIDYLGQSLRYTVRH